MVDWLCDEECVKEILPYLSKAYSLHSMTK